MHTPDRFTWFLKRDGPELVRATLARRGYLTGYRERARQWLEEQENATMIDPRDITERRKGLREAVSKEGRTLGALEGIYDTLEAIRLDLNGHELLLEQISRNTSGGITFSRD